MTPIKHNRLKKTLWEFQYIELLLIRKFAMFFGHHPYIIFSAQWNYCIPTSYEGYPESLWTWVFPVHEVFLSDYILKLEDFVWPLIMILICPLITITFKTLYSLRDASRFVSIYEITDTTVDDAMCVSKQEFLQQKKKIEWKNLTPRRKWQMIRFKEVFIRDSSTSAPPH